MPAYLSVVCVSVWNEITTPGGQPCTGETRLVQGLNLEVLRTTAQMAWDG